MANLDPLLMYSRSKNSCKCNMQGNDVIQVENVKGENG